MFEEQAEVEEAEEVVETNENSVDYGEDFDVYADESEEPEPEKVEETETTSKGDTEPEEETKTEEPEPDENQELEDSKKVIDQAKDTINTGFKGAYLSEKEKRQALELENQQLKGNQQTAKKDDQPEFDFSDPDKAINSIRSEMKNDVVIMKADLSEAQCKRNNPDYDEKYHVFKGMVQADNSLVDKMLSQPDPAQWAYDQAKNHEATSDIIADPAAYKAKMKAEIIAELKNEQIDNETIDDKIKKEVEKLPPSGNSNSGNIIKKEPEDDKDYVENLFDGR